MKKMQIQLLTTIIIGTGMIFNPSFAFDVEEVDNEEIVHLLEFIGNADCKFVRNGVEYRATHAKLFIEYKYDIVKDEIGSTEEFIKITASKSRSSGDDYKVRCDGAETTSANWLARELASYRHLLSSNMVEFSE